MPFEGSEMSDSSFVRVIKRREVLTLAFGAMIGWSWVALSGGWIETAGSAGAMLAFAGVDSEGNTVNSDDWRGRRILLKFFRGSW